MVTPDITPGRLKGKMTRLDKTAVKLCENRIYGQNHIGKIVVYHSDYDRRFGSDDVNGGETDFGEQTVDYSRILQNCHPGIGSDEKVHPHGNHDEGHHGFLHLFARPCHDICNGIAEKEAYRRGNDGELKRTQEYNYIGANLGRAAVVAGDGACGGEKTGDVFGGEGKGIVGEGVIGHENKRNDREKQRPHRIGGYDPSQAGKICFCVFFHSSSPLSGSASSSSSFEKEE